jgi:hypothetical protein
VQAVGFPAMSAGCRLPCNVGRGNEKGRESRFSVDPTLLPARLRRRRVACEPQIMSGVYQRLVGDLAVALERDRARCLLHPLAAALIVPLFC